MPTPRRWPASSIASRSSAQPREGGPLSLHCWPQATHQRHPARRKAGRRRRLRGRRRIGGDEAIVVTGSRDPRPPCVGRRRGSWSRCRRIWATSSSTASPSRSPSPPTARSRSRSCIRPRRAGRHRLPAAARPGRARTSRRPVAAVAASTRNRSAEGLGLPLPAGGSPCSPTAGPAGPARRGRIVDDRAVGEDVEIEFARRPACSPRGRGRAAADGRWRDYRLIVTSDRPAPIRFEAEFEGRRARDFRPERPLPPPRRPAALGGDRARQRQRGPALPDPRDATDD